MASHLRLLLAQQVCVSSRLADAGAGIASPNSGAPHSPPREHHGQGTDKRAGGDVQKDRVGSKPSFVTGRAGWPIVPAEMIAEGRMFVWSDGAGGLEKSELPLCRAFILPTAPVPNHEAVGFDLPPNGGLSTIWRGGFEALHCLTSPPSMVSVVFSPL